MRLSLIGILMAVACAVAQAGEGKEKARDDEPVRGSSAGPNQAWLAALERVRALPGPGQIVVADTRVDLAALHEPAPETAAKLKALGETYQAELLKLAAKWEQDARSLRAEYEAKMIEALPEARREAARAALKLSQERWTTPLDREAAFQREFTERVVGLRARKLQLSAEQYEEESAKIQTWVKQERARIRKQDEELRTQLRGLLAPEEAARFDQLTGKKSETNAKPPAPAPRGR
jgi:hypothetical protein